MFGKFSEQLKSTTKPVQTLFAVNTKTLESLSQHQTALFTGLLSDSVRYLESVTKQTELKGVLNANSELAESVRERMTSASKETYSTLNTMREEVAEFMTASLATVSDDVKDVVAKTTTTVKKAASTAPKPVKKTVEKAADSVEKVVEKTTEKAEATAKVTEDAVKETSKAAEEAAPVAAAPKEPVAKKTTTRTRRTPAKKATTAKSTN